MVCITHKHQRVLLSLVISLNLTILFVLGIFPSSVHARLTGGRGRERTQENNSSVEEIEDTVAALRATNQKSHSPRRILQEEEDTTDSVNSDSPVDAPLFNLDDLETADSKQGKKARKEAKREARKAKKDAKAETRKGKKDAKLEAKKAKRAAKKAKKGKKGSSQNSDFDFDLNDNEDFDTSEDLEVELNDNEELEVNEDLDEDQT